MIIFTKKDDFSGKYFSARWDKYLGQVSESAKKLIDEYELSNFLELVVLVCL